MIEERTVELLLKKTIETINRHYQPHKEVLVDFGTLGDKDMIVKETSQTTLDDYIDLGIDKVDGYESYHFTLNRKRVSPKEIERLLDKVLTKVA